MNKIIIFLILSVFSILSSVAQEKKTDANLIGHVVCCDEHIPFASVFIKGTTIGTTTDESGHYMLINLPAGTHTIVAQVMGYVTQEQTFTIQEEETKEIKFDLKEDVLGLDEIVVTGDRNTKSRRTASVIVNSLTPRLLEATQSVTLSDGLNFCPGLRMENNCQNCGFNQVRMNGMQGPYSQILINSRPIFSGLAGVYGLELIPANMIERIEVVRGGGSALYGSNAIAGTINLILKDPIKNSYEFGLSNSIIGLGMNDAGDPANDYSLNFNSSLVSADSKTGIALYGFNRKRNHFDANNDNFSELAIIENTTIGGRLYHRFGYRSRVNLDFFSIKENRRGGDLFDYPVHEANIAEAINHSISTMAATYEQFFRETDLWSVYVSGQFIDRDSYYGAEKSLKDYGDTRNFTNIIGTQYNANFGFSNLSIGIENKGDWLNDKKLGYLDVENATIEADGSISALHTDNTIIADQSINILGVFSQYEMNWDKMSVSLGARFDNYKIEDKENNADEKSGNVLSPRITLKYDILESLQGRVSYSQGYRAPQIFDEDLHIETSGSRQVIHVNDPDLKQETSHSYMASLDYNKKLNGINFGFLVEGFYTKLNDAFANDYGDPDENGTVIYTRVNTENGANVQGVNMEMNVVPNSDLYLKSGFTIQNSMYKDAQEFNEKGLFKSPSNYGYLSADWRLVRKFKVSLSGNYTGKMLVPYFGTETVELRESDPFFDLGAKISYTVKLNGASVQFFTGVKNIFNSYQNDFDSGIDRDPGYVYGPGLPRTIYFGFKFGNMLKR